MGNREQSLGSWGLDRVVSGRIGCGMYDGIWDNLWWGDRSRLRASSSKSGGGAFSWTNGAFHRIIAATPALDPGLCPRPWLTPPLPAISGLESSGRRWGVSTVVVAGVGVLGVFENN